uniref:Uncharacterized protein n=1 Tax=Cacopsylla melanoneura TaxID=428564 RepID=A0A8D8Z4F2_9HEMI
MKKSKVPDSPSTIYNNMSHHYRRLFGAKAVVDSSSPFHLNNRHLQSHHRASSSQSLNKLSSCDSARPSSCKFPRKLSNSTMSLYSKNFVPCPRLQKTHQNPYIKEDILLSSDISPFKPRILKSSVESKLRQLQGVYFPPRKKTRAAAGTEWETMNVEIETEDNLKPWLRKKLMPPHLSCDKTNPHM